MPLQVRNSYVTKDSKKKISCLKAFSEQEASAGTPPALHCKVR